jgi:hypothetical protein
LNRFRTYWWSGRPLKLAVALANSHVYAAFLERHGCDALEAFYSLLERGHGVQAYKQTRAILFGDGELTITSDAESPPHTFLLEGGDSAD